MYSLPTDDFRQYINGELVSGRGRTTQIRCPGNGEPVAQIALTTKEQAQQALEAAGLTPVTLPARLERTDAGGTGRLDDEVAGRHPA